MTNTELHLQLIIDLVRHLHRLTGVTEHGANVQVSFYNVSGELISAARAAGGEHRTAMDPSSGNEWDSVSITVGAGTCASFYSKDRPIGSGGTPT